MPYLKGKCRDCNSVMWVYFATKEEMPQAEKGEYIEYYCDICDKKRLLEVLQGVEALP